MPKRAATSSSVTPSASHKRALNRRQMRTSRSSRRRFSIFFRRMVSNSKDMAHASYCCKGIHAFHACYRKFHHDEGIKNEGHDAQEGQHALTDVRGSRFRISSFIAGHGHGLLWRENNRTCGVNGTSPSSGKI